MAVLGKKLSFVINGEGCKDGHQSLLISQGLISYKGIGIQISVLITGQAVKRCDRSTPWFLMPFFRQFGLVLLRMLYFH